MKENFEKNVYALMAELKKFDYSIEGSDFLWEIILPFQKVMGGKSVYHSIRVIQYEDTFYIAHIDGNLSSLEVQMRKSIQAVPSVGFSSYEDARDDPAKGWDGIISSARSWLKIVQKDWFKANKQVRESYPLNRRYGIVCSSLVRELLLDFYRIDQELGKTKTKKFIRLVEQGYFRNQSKVTAPTMTANSFFEYCKIAYISGKRKDDIIDENLSGRQMYERYADGRDEGLLEIDGKSQEEFADWIDGKHPKRTSGGHPWEIKRGGNTTHIDLCVTRPLYNKNEGFLVQLRGRSMSRLKETICMFLGIHDAGLPITIDDPEGIRKRLLGQDNFGIVPCFHTLHRANQHFSEREAVYDVLHYDDLGRYKSRIQPFITWEPLPILKPCQMT